MRTNIMAEIVYRRLMGDSIREVGEKLSISHENVRKYLAQLQPDENDGKEVFCPELSDEQKRCLAELIASTKGDVDKISSFSGLTPEEVRATIRYIRTRRHAPVQMCVYPAISKWMRLNAVTTPELAKRSGIPLSILSKILCGKRYITVDVVNALCSTTGMTAKDLLDGMYQNPG